MLEEGEGHLHERQLHDSLFYVSERFREGTGTPGLVWKGGGGQGEGAEVEFLLLRPRYSIECRVQKVEGFRFDVEDSKTDGLTRKLESEETGGRESA